MSIRDLLKEKKMSIYRLSKSSGVPYATLNDICNEKARLDKCSAGTVWQIAKALDITMEEILEPYMGENILQNPANTVMPGTLSFEENRLNLAKGELPFDDASIYQENPNISENQNRLISKKNTLTSKKRKMRRENSL